MNKIDWLIATFVLRKRQEIYEFSFKKEELRQYLFDYRNYNF